MNENLLKTKFARAVTLTLALTFAMTLALTTILLGLLSAGCDARRDESSRIDVQWHRSNLVDGLLPQWLAAAPAEAGFLRTSFGQSLNGNLGE